MLIVISPAKTLDYETQPNTQQQSLPDFIDDSALLIERMRQLEPNNLVELMGISSKLAELNHRRYLNWSLKPDTQNAKQAVLAFKGDVYTGLEAQTFSEDEFDYAQQHLRILSGLYGVLKPLDLMQPYRLEMGTKIDNARGKNLYEFWGDKPAKTLNQQLDSIASKTLVNLASQEYFKAVNTKILNADIITPVFKDEKNGTYKVISFFAKKARGLMSAWIIKNKVEDVSDLCAFDTAGYRYSEEQSSHNEYVFLRDEAA